MLPTFLQSGRRGFSDMVAAGKRRVAVLLFEGFEVLDVYGPVEAFKGSEHFEVVTIAEKEGPVASGQGPKTISEQSFLGNYTPFEILLVPGGKGTRQEVDNKILIDWLAKQGSIARGSSSPLKVMSVCTGAALLARAGVFDGLPATGNKRGFEWIKSMASPDADIEWNRQARWVETANGNIWSSAGVSAGIDMVLSFIGSEYGVEHAQQVVSYMEYNGQWRDGSHDQW